MKKKRILVLIADNGGVGFYRSVQPHEYIAEHYSDEFEIHMAESLPKEGLEEYLKLYDLICFHKKLDDNLTIIKLIKSLGIPCILDIDDHYDLGQYHPMSLTARRDNWKKPILEHIALADYVSTTTDIFKKVLLKTNKNVVVFPNAIDPTDERFKIEQTKSDRIRFGIICGSSHLHDIMLLEGMTRQLPNDVIDKIQFVLCGYDTNGTRTIYDQATGQVTRRPIRPEESTWFDYEKIITDNYRIVSEQHRNFLLRFIPQMEWNSKDEPYRRCWTKPIDKYYKHYENIDVLLVPLKECDFNSVKSQLKVIECGFAHKAIIAQNFGPYTIDLKNMIEKGGKVNENGNALLVDSSKNHKQWAKYIERIVKEPELIEKLSNNLYETVKDTYDLKNVCEKRVEFYRQILNRE